MTETRGDRTTPGQPHVIDDGDGVCGDCYRTTPDTAPSTTVDPARVRRRLERLWKHEDYLNDWLEWDDIPALLDELARLTADNQRLTQRAAAAEKVIEAGQRYHAMYMAGPKADQCPKPIWSGSHDDHDCLVSLHARVLASVAAYDRAVQQQPGEEG